VMVALARAAETASVDPLTRDQFAEPLVSTPEPEGVREQVAAWWAPEPDEEDDPDLTVDSQHMINYQAVRTHFFDGYFTLIRGLSDVMPATPGPPDTRGRLT